jgi:hypothetical protein
MFDAKILAISLSANKTFLATHLFNDNGNGPMELVKGEQLKHIQDKFFELTLPNVHNLVAFFKHHSGRGYIDNILDLKSKSHYDYVFKNVAF